jgi:sigma-B regulation protein RsbU (phosphoserine phosphatase)
VWQELEIARRLQREMLPQGQPQLPGTVIEAKSIPATEVGGDFYDIIPLDENRFAIIIGDVSGKGISGAIGMSSAMSALRFAADMQKSTDKILELANQRLVRDIQRTMFVAVFLGIYDRKLRRLFYTNAGQTMPILLRKSKADFLTQSEADRFPLGIRPEVKFMEQEFDIHAGDILVCYTDGIVELAKEAGNGYEPYGFDRFKYAIEANANNNLQTMLQGLIEDAGQFSGNVINADDVTLVILKFS